ncbi:hypothetical protein ACFLUU_00600 [Chloroflexota bacterium]
MLKSIERLKTDHKLDLSASYIRKLNDSKKGKGAIHVNYGLNTDENADTRIARGYLDQHFNSSPYGWVMNDKERGMIKWIRIANEEVDRCIKLLRAIDREATKVTGYTMNNPNFAGYIGPAYWFSDSVFDSVLENLYKSLAYKDESPSCAYFKF